MSEVGKLHDDGHVPCNKYVVSPSLWLVIILYTTVTSNTSELLTTRSSSEVSRDSTNHTNAQLGSTSCLLV